MYTITAAIGTGLKSHLVSTLPQWKIDFIAQFLAQSMRCFKNWPIMKQQVKALTETKFLS